MRAGSTRTRCPGWKEKDPEIYSGDPTHFAEDGELIGLHVMPKPYQKPHPPIYQAADSTSSYTFAGDSGDLHHHRR